MISDIRKLYTREREPLRGLLAAEWAAMAYLLFTLLMMAVHWPQLADPAGMLLGRAGIVASTVALWGLYRWLPCRLTLLLRVVWQMVLLSWWYPDTYELNRMLPNLDHVFAACEQWLFGCQPSLLFAEAMPWGWFSELMCLGYWSYYPLMGAVAFYYFIFRYEEFGRASFVILGSFFVYYVIFVLLPVTGPQFYYLAAGTDSIRAGVFPDMGHWFLTHREAMDVPGWRDGLFYHLVEQAHAAGERPTAAFPSSHVGVTTVLMLLALRTRSLRLTLGMLPFYVLMCFSTVYILAHYTIDAIAGFFTGIAIYHALMRAWR